MTSFIPVADGAKRERESVRVCVALSGLLVGLTVWYVDLYCNEI